METSLAVVSKWLQIKWLYLIYRWALALYFFAWLVYTLVQAHDIGWKYLIYLTHWGFITWNSYLTYSATLVTIKVLTRKKTRKVHCCDGSLPQPDSETHNKNLIHAERGLEQEGCLYCDCKVQFQTTWKEKLHRALFIISSEFAVGISILFWILFYDPYNTEVTFSAYSLHVHLFNGVSAIIDLWVVGIPVRMLHVLYIILFGSLYAAFTGLYYAFNGTDPAGKHYIYPMLDYKHNPAYASGLIIASALAFLCLIHLLFFSQYLMRRWIIDLLHHKPKLVN